MCYVLQTHNTCYRHVKCITMKTEEREQDKGNMYLTNGHEKHFFPPHTYYKDGMF